MEDMQCKDWIKNMSSNDDIEGIQIVINVAIAWGIQDKVARGYEKGRVVIVEDFDK